MRHWILVAGGMVGATLLLFFLFRPGLRVGPENGAFANDCCGTIELRDGGMRLNDKQTVHYAVGRDARGPYILPRTYVGALEDRGFEVDGTRQTARLRLDRLPRPNLILLHEGPTPYVFTREPGRGR